MSRVGRSQAPRVRPTRTSVVPGPDWAEAVADGKTRRAARAPAIRVRSMAELPGRSMWRRNAERGKPGCDRAPGDHAKQGRAGQVPPPPAESASPSNAGSDAGMVARTEEPVSLGSSSSAGPARERLPRAMAELPPPPGRSPQRRLFRVEWIRFSLEVRSMENCSFVLVVLALTAGSTASAQGFRLSAPLAERVIGNVDTFLVSPDGSRVIFSASAEGPQGSGYDLFSVPVAGGTCTTLTPSPPSTLHSAKVTPDSAYVVYGDAGLFRLLRVPIDGGPATQLTPLGDNRIVNSFQIAPDGNWVVYTIQDGFSNLQLYSVPLGGGAATLLDTAVQGYSIISDSARVVYGRSSSPRYLLSISIAGGTPTRLDSSSTGVKTWSPSPDATRVAYVADQDTAGTYELYSVATSGGVPVKLNGALTTGGDVGAAGGVLTDPRISRDSTRVVYTADQDTDEVFELYSAPITGGPSVKLNGAFVAGGDVSWDEY